MSYTVTNYCVDKIKVIWPHTVDLAVEEIIGVVVVSVFHLHDAGKEGHRRSHQHSLLIFRQAFKPCDVGRRTLVGDQPSDH